MSPAFTKYDVDSRKRRSSPSPKITKHVPNPWNIAEWWNTGAEREEEKSN